MISYREGLARIGIQPTDTVAYRDFVSSPQSLRQAIQSMDAPASNEWNQVSDIFRDEYWTDEVQGVAYDNAHWIFSANANPIKPGHNDKAIYVFPAGSKLEDGQWSYRIDYKDVPHPVQWTEDDDHWGQLTYYDGCVYVAHFWKGGPKEGMGNVVVFKDHDGVLEFARWIELAEKPTSPTDGRTRNVEFQAINPWDGLLYTCFGDGDIHELFLYDMEGKYTGRTLKLSKPLKTVQGACFSPNGHLFVSTVTVPGFPEYLQDEHPKIWYCSALNGHVFGAIDVLAEEAGQELEGICHAEVGFPDGHTAQIHAILLENREPALDNIFFKSFSCARPDLV